MIKTNKKMSFLLNEVNWKDKTLVVALDNISNDSFVNVNGCIVMKSFHKLDTNVLCQDFPDKTGYECFINSLHIDDFAPNDIVAQSLLFVKSVFIRWKQFSSYELLRAIVSIDEFDAVVKFHLVRDGENLLNDNLEGYEEALLIVDSSWDTGVETLAHSKQLT